MRKKGIIFLVSLLFCLGAAALIGCGGGGDDGGSSDNGGGGGTTGSTSATSNVTSTTSGTIQTQSGAAISVPSGAVPRNTTGAAGTVAFSIERALNVAATPPSGITRVGDMYHFGPEGMTFSTPVRVTIPVTGNINRDNIALYRINPTTGANERYPSTYDPTTNTVSAMTYQFSPWYPGSGIGGTRDGKSDGCFKVDNSTTFQWRRVCVVNYTLKYPEQSSSLPAMANQGAISSLWSNSSCSSGWCNQGNWYLLQGTYNFCVDAQSTPNGPYSHGFINGAAINSPWYYDAPTCSNLGIGISLPNAGECDCTPTPTPTFGTGGLQATLTWHSTPSVDLDMWIIEPDGTKTFYGRTPSPSGGTLDRDNQCSNYEDGKPENIYYATAPAGQYKIQINWFRTCSGSISSVPYTVRIVNKGTSKTYSGSISSGGTVTVDTITVN